ncbi:MAG: FHA domain-containing protein [Defluviitaleaceae bacterium]|nr:FHA domain-containing protein [Defluviitaleaceae bacterium]
MKGLISEEVKMGKPFVTVTAGDRADENAFQMMTYTKPPFIPPITASEINGERIFSYDISADGFKRLGDLPSALSPSQFIVFMKNLTQVVIDCRDYLLDPLNFLMSEEHLFIHPEVVSVRVVYLPILDTTCSEADISRQVYDLARNLSRRFSANDLSADWQSVISHLWNMPERVTIYEAHEIYAGLCDKEKKVASPPPAPVKQVPPPSPAKPPQQPTPAPAKKEPEAKKPGLFGKQSKPAEQPKKKGLFGKSLDNPTPPSEPKQKKSLFGFGEKKPKPAPPEKNTKKPLFGKPAPLPVANDATETIDVTEIVENDGNNAVLYIVEQGAKTTMIPINKSNFVVGRNRDEVDYCIDGDKAISRVHMQLSNVDGNYYITDKQSSGGTIVNGKKLLPNAPEGLEHGSIIKIGRKELLFELA